MDYHYQQAIELLFSPATTKDDLIDAYGDISAEYAHVYAMALHGLRSNVEPELSRLRTVKESLKFKLKHWTDQNMIDLTTSGKILDYCQDMGYPIKDDFNIIYIEGFSNNGRLNSDDPNQFNDCRCIFNSKQCLDVWEATTEPGYYYTDRPLNPNGAFRIAFGYHPEAWVIDLHGYNDTHEALVQIAEINGYRDYNRDMMRTDDPEVVGCFGINQHWGYDLPYEDISTASAGCLVGRTRKGHREFMDYCRKSGRKHFSTIVLPGNKIFT